MSCIETHIGKLIRLATPDNINSWLVEQGINIDEKSSYDRYTIYYNKSYCPRYLVTKSDELFEVKDTRVSEGDSICQIEKTCENEYTYVLQFYNGGTCFSEELEDGLDKIDF